MDVRLLCQVHLACSTLSFGASGPSGLFNSFLLCVRSSWLAQVLPSVQAGAEMNVGDYYQTAYKIKLNPSLPA